MFSHEQWYLRNIENKLQFAVPDKLWDHSSYASKLLSGYRELKETQDALDSKRKEFDSKMASICDRRWELAMQEQQLERELKKYDQYIFENDRKRDRATRKSHALRQQMIIKQKEFLLHKQNFHKLKTDLTDRKKRLQKLSTYTGFLESVVTKAHEFDEIHEVLSRYETLTITLQELKEKELQNQAKIDAARFEHTEYMKDKSSEVMELNGLITILQTRLDKVEHQARILDSDFQAIKTNAARQTLELGRMKMAIHTMYSRILEMQASRRYQEFNEDTIQQLTKIENYIMDLKDIVNEKEFINAGSLFAFLQPNN